MTHYNGRSRLALATNELDQIFEEFENILSNLINIGHDRNLVVRTEVAPLVRVTFEQVNTLRLKVMAAYPDREDRMTRSYDDY